VRQSSEHALPPDQAGARVLVVDDEPDLCTALRHLLTRHGFSVETVGTRSEAMERASSFDLVVLDLGLPDGDGLDICGALARQTPVVVVSARADEVDRVVALELGADDYLAKPFGGRELVARCRSVLRRAGGPRVRHVVRLDDLEIDLERYEVRRAGLPVDLTTKERQLLVALAQRGGGVVRREELAAEVWGGGLWPVNRSLDVHMSSLRRKLGDTAREARYIQTMHGIGFRLLR
jgi:DNA-binding response OmpR family regulator